MSHPKKIANNCCMIGVVGRTNVGKSTLINQIVGEKISIVTPVVQTTRNTIRGVLTEPRGQIVLVDTPGLHKAEGTLGTLMNRMARQAAANVDALLVVFDGSCAPEIEDDGWMRLDHVKNVRGVLEHGIANGDGMLFHKFKV